MYHCVVGGVKIVKWQQLEWCGTLVLKAPSQIDLNKFIWFLYHLVANPINYSQQIKLFTNKS